MASFSTTDARASYQRLPSTIGKRKPAASDNAQVVLSELIAVASLAKTATTEAAYNLRRSRLKQLLKTL